MRHLYYVCIVFVLLSSCDSKKKHQKVPDAGVISYSIQYPDEINNSPSGTLMPKEMKFIFFKDKLKYHLKGSFNIFSLDFISTSPNDSCTTLFRFIDQNLISTTAGNKLIFFFDREEQPEITYFMKETKVISGFNCQKAVVKFKDSKPFDVFFTHEIKLQNPNRNSPLMEIEGVLLEFFVDFNHVRFHFTANNFDHTTPAPSEFKISTEAKQSSQDEIQTLITTLINNFQ